MATYNCVPASKTVPPCPSGTAPANEYVTSSASPEYYPGQFDHLPVQDILVGSALIFSLLLGLMAGRH